MFQLLKAWPTALLLRYVAVSSVTLFCLVYLFIFRDDSQNFITSHREHDHAKGYFAIPISRKAKHPIDNLIHDARRDHEALLLKRTFDVESAADEYRTRRGRHPPPGFDRWVKHALEHDAIIIEDFFDRIYHDLTPFWALEPKSITRRAATWHNIVRVRNGTASGVAREDTGFATLSQWMTLWTDLVAEMSEDLPDLDMPFNYYDESRLLVPWEVTNAYIKHEGETRHMPSPSRVTSRYQVLRDDDDENLQGPAQDPVWKDDARRWWDYVALTCPPDSPARQVPRMADEDSPLTPGLPTVWEPSYAWKGYVKNVTASMDPCYQPHLRTMHATFIEPQTTSVTEELIPLFGGSKLLSSSDILIPGAMYLDKDPFYSGGDTHGPPWEAKRDGVVWRGGATGGSHLTDNWTHFQRARLVQMLNGTTVSNIEAGGVRGMTFDLPPLQLYDFERRRNGKIGQWLASGFSDVGFVDVLCKPERRSPNKCDRISPHFSAVPRMAMKEQFEYKFAPQADGNSYSARYRAFVLSTSLPLKATIYAEWHDDRLTPWLHYAPMDNTFQDMYATLDYFTDSGDRERNKGKGDAAAQWIAEQGKQWGEKVLRRADMRLYVWRLLLEWARVCSEDRDMLGFVEDLLE